MQIPLANFPFGIRLSGKMHNSRFIYRNFARGTLEMDGDHGA
jgi:hypothetical protein